MERDYEFYDLAELGGNHKLPDEAVFGIICKDEQGAVAEYEQLFGCRPTVVYQGSGARYAYFFTIPQEESEVNVNQDGKEKGGE